jgi:hypothetical protein
MISGAVEFKTQITHYPGGDLNNSSFCGIQTLSINQIKLYFFNFCKMRIHQRLEQNICCDKLEDYYPLIEREGGMDLDTGMRIEKDRGHRGVRVGEKGLGENV